jgi:hypothetical protein
MCTGGDQTLQEAARASLAAELVSRDEELRQLAAANSRLDYALQVRTGRGPLPAGGCESKAALTCSCQPCTAQAAGMAALQPSTSPPAHTTLLLLPTPNPSADNPPPHPARQPPLFPAPSGRRALLPVLHQPGRASRRGRRDESRGRAAGGPGVQQVRHAYGACIVPVLGCTAPCSTVLWGRGIGRADV